MMLNDEQLLTLWDTIASENENKDLDEMIIAFGNAVERLVKERVVSSLTQFLWDLEEEK